MRRSSLLGGRDSVSTEGARIHDAIIALAVSLEFGNWVDVATMRIRHG